jgi:hypothetical protein
MTEQTQNPIPLEEDDRAYEPEIDDEEIDPGEDYDDYPFDDPPDSYDDDQDNAAG